MSQAIEALLRACDALNPRSRDVEWARVVEAAAAVRASLAPKPVPDGELLPCPFCGGRTQIVTYGGDAGSFQGGRFVACMICESASLVCWGDEAADRRIAEAWNRRAELAREPVELIPLRDTFAAAALTGCLAYSHVNPARGNYQENATPDSVAVDCYAYADAMMVARAARGESLPQPPREDEAGE